MYVMGCEIGIPGTGTNGILRVLAIMFDSALELSVLDMVIVMVMGRKVHYIMHYAGFLGSKSWIWEAKVFVMATYVVQIRTLGYRNKASLLPPLCWILGFKDNLRYHYGEFGYLESWGGKAPWRLLLY